MNKPPQGIGWTYLSVPLYDGYEDDHKLMASLKSQLEQTLKETFADLDPNRVFSYGWREPEIGGEPKQLRVFYWVFPKRLDDVKIDEAVPYDTFDVFPYEEKVAYDGRLFELRKFTFSFGPFWIWQRTS